MGQLTAGSAKMRADRCGQDVVWQLLEEDRAWRLGCEWRRGEGRTLSWQTGWRNPGDTGVI